MKRETGIGLAEKRVDTAMEVKMIDFHSHILWEMDDGVHSLKQALSMAALAIEEGIHTIVATPHCIDEIDLKVFAKKVDKQCTIFREALLDKQLEVDIIAGAEVYLDPNYLGMEGLEELTVGGTPYMLVEMPMREIPRYTEDFIYHLQLKGFIPIIGHPERNLDIIEAPNRLAEFIELGALAQVNTGSITGFFGTRVQECARILFKHKMVHLLGTDAHSDGKRGPYMKQAVDILKDWIDKEQVNTIVGITPYNILQGKIIPIEPPKRYKPRRGIFRFFR
jgi:protein-tyrosine phosphatase